jgi:hypothetical protein
LLFAAVNTSLIAGFRQSLSAGRSRLSMTDSDQAAYQRFVEKQINPYNLVPASYYQDLIRSTTQQTARRTEAWRTRIRENRCTVSTLALFKRKSENADFINFSKLADAYQQATALSQTPSPFTPFTNRNASTYDRSAQQDQLQVAQSKQAIDNIFSKCGINNPNLYNEIGDLDTQLRGILEPFFGTQFVTVSDLILQNIPLLEGSSDQAGSIITVPLGDCLKRYYNDADIVSLAQNRRSDLATADTLITKAEAQYPQIAPIWRGHLCDAYELFLSSGITILAARVAAYELIETIRELQTTCKTTLIGFLRKLKSITQQQQTTYASAVSDKLMSAAPPFTVAENHQLIALIPQWTTQSPDLKKALDALSKTAEQQTKAGLELIATLTAEIPDIHDAPEITQLKTELGRLHRVFAAANKQVYNHAALCAALVPPAPRSARTDVVWTNGAAEGGVSDDDETELASESSLVAHDEEGDELSGDGLPTPREGGAWSGGQRTDSGPRTGKISRTGIYSLKETHNSATSVSLKDSDGKPIQDAQALYYSHRLQKYKVVRADNPDHTYLEDTSERQKTAQTLELRFTSNIMTLQAADGESLI